MPISSLENFKWSEYYGKGEFPYDDERTFTTLTWLHETHGGCIRGTSGCGIDLAPNHMPRAIVAAEAGIATCHMITCREEDRP